MQPISPKTSPFTGLKIKISQDALRKGIPKPDSIKLKKLSEQIVTGDIIPKIDTFDKNNRVKSKKNTQTNIESDLKSIPNPNEQQETINRKNLHELQTGSKVETEQTGLDIEENKKFVSELSYPCSIFEKLEQKHSWLNEQISSKKEAEALPEFFSQNSTNKNVYIYQKIRNFIIRSYWIRPEKKVVFSAIRRNINGDVGGTLRIFKFLEQEGIINCMKGQRGQPEKQTAIDCPNKSSVPNHVIKSELDIVPNTMNPDKSDLLLTGTLNKKMSISLSTKTTNTFNNHSQNGSGKTNKRIKLSKRSFMEAFKFPVYKFGELKTKEEGHGRLLRLKNRTKKFLQNKLADHFKICKICEEKTSFRWFCHVENKIKGKIL